MSHDLALSLKFTTKAFVEFAKFNWSYDLLRYMLQDASYGLPFKNTHLQISNRFSHALPRVHNGKGIKAGPQSGPVT